MEYEFAARAGEGPRRPTFGLVLAELRSSPAGHLQVLFLLHDQPHLRMLADGFEAAVDEDADVAFGLTRDFGNLEVAKAVGPEVDGFALGRWQLFD